jgi:hypothetical protein
MRSFTIHAAPSRPAAPTSVPVTEAKFHPARLPELVPEGFSLIAALVPPLWFLAHRLWLVLAIYVALVALAGFLLPGRVLPIAIIAAHVLVGFSAQDLRRWTLARRGLPIAGVVMARDAEAALLRALDARPALAAGIRP